MPLFRSRVEAEVLVVVLANPEREWSLTELARRVGASVATVQREIGRAEEAGVVRSRKVGNTRLVRADEHGALTQPLTDLLERALGPKQLLSEALSAVPGVEAAFLFGSWAARCSGDRGPAPNDHTLRRTVTCTGRARRSSTGAIASSSAPRSGSPITRTSMSFGAGPR